MMKKGALWLLACMLGLIMPPRASTVLAVGCLLALVAAVTAGGLVLFFVVARHRGR